MSQDPVRPELAIEAFCFESRFNLKELPGWLPAGVECRATKTQIVAQLASNGTLFAFDFGALVFVDAAPEAIKTVLSAFQERLTREPHPPLRETFRLRVDPTLRLPEVSFDAVAVPELSRLGLECVANVLAQSVTIDYYDEDLGHMLEKVGAIAQDFAKTGRMASSRRELVQFVARSIGSQVEMINSISLLDKPDFTWEDEAAERLYDVLRHHLEIPERHRALETKLTTVRGSLSQFLELHAVRRSFVLEALVVALILFEIILSVSERLAH